MKNKELFQRDPSTAKLLNDGVATVNENRSRKEIETLRFELEHFVCEGQYHSGFIRILESYVGNYSSTVQPAAWVSGFYGSGKSHLLKMFRHLWVNHPFESDGVTPRGLAHLPQDVTDTLRELDVLGRRSGGLHAAAGTLPSGGGESVRLATLGIIFRSKGMPTSYPQAKFLLWLKKNGILDPIKQKIEEHGKDFVKELADLYVSPLIANALLSVYPDFAQDKKTVRSLLRDQFPVVADIPTADFIKTTREVLDVDGQLPCTVIVLDEIQLFIGEDSQRSTDVQEVAEALCKQLDSRILVIGSGQTALAGSLPHLQRLSGRFTIPVELSDSDVETVTRRVVLAKKANKRTNVDQLMNTYAGEIDRHLAGTRIGPRSEDRYTFTDDYPLLPVRRRFWERVLRAVDIPGTASQLRTQLRVVYDAVREIADAPVGTVTPADFIFEEQRANMLQSGMLLREIDETIQNMGDKNAEGRLAKRLCELIFLIRKLPRDQVVDIGVHATPEMLADLLVEDLDNDGAKLRKQIPAILKKLVEQGKLIKLDDEYSLQTRESAEWEREFRNRQTRLNNDLTLISGKRTTFLTEECTKVLSSQKLLQGKSKQPRKVSIYYGQEPPATGGHEIPVWIRDGWGDNEKAIIADARAAGNDSSIIYVFIPKASAEEFKKAIIDYEAAKATLDFKGSPSTDEGREARDAMSTRMSAAEDARKRIIQEVINNARVFQGGGNERFELDMVEKVRSAAEASMDRLFPRFKDADDPRWPSVINRAKNGDEGALQAIGWNDAPEKQPVCSAIAGRIGPGKLGREIREEFENSPYGWPRDAIDAALIMLHTIGFARISYKGQQLPVGQLDQVRIPMAEFRVESSVINAADKIRLRKLFQNAGIHCQSGEELVKAGEYLSQLSDLADRAGGEPPLPAKPSRAHIETLRTLAGNEQLARILAQYDTLESQCQAWSQLSALAEQRKREWDICQNLVEHAKDIDIPELTAQLDAIRNDRRLLAEPNPLVPVRKEVVKILRDSLNTLYESFRSDYDSYLHSLEKSENWEKLNQEQRQNLLKQEGLDGLPEIETGDECALLRSLDKISLVTWKTKIQALPQQFANVALAAAQLLEPETRKIHLSSQILRTPDDVKKWSQKVEKELLEDIKKGPIIIS